MTETNRLTQLFGIDLPIIQAPMAGANDAAMVIAVSGAGGLGSLPCAMLDVDGLRQQLETITAATQQPFNVNFFCHKVERPSPVQDALWSEALLPYYKEVGLDVSEPVAGNSREPFSEAMCELVEEFKPAVVSFHFGLPEEALLMRVKATGCKVMSSATTLDEAIWLEKKGCDVVIAQGVEAGGHRGMFRTSDVDAQSSLLVLLPQIIDAVNVPVIAAGGIADRRGIAAVQGLGASGVQLGTAYLFCHESLISDLHRLALLDTPADSTALTNIFSGRPARGLINRVMREIGPICDSAPPFPAAGTKLTPLKSHHEKNASTDFSSLWSGEGYALTREFIRRIPKPAASAEDQLCRIDAARLTILLGKSF